MKCCHLIAGGCPAASYFLCFAKESNQRKATRGSSPRQKRRGALRYSKQQAAAELGLVDATRKRSCLCSPSDSPRGMPLSFLRYSATLIGTRSAGNDGLKLFVISNAVRNLLFVFIKRSSRFLTAFEMTGLIQWELLIPPSSQRRLGPSPSKCLKIRWTGFQPTLE